MMNPVIAIDGPAASGKSTVARKLAGRLNYIYVDTGAMYRAYAWLALEKKVDPGSRPAVCQLIEEHPLKLSLQNGAVLMLLNETDPAPFIRDKRVNAAVSKIASIPELREKLVIAQRILRNQAPLVMEGRDIGTVVFTDTPYKFFLDADPEIRAQRREQQGQSDTVTQRDNLDRNRMVAPLIKAADAEKVDATHDSADQIVEKVLLSCARKGLEAAKP